MIFKIYIHENDDFYMKVTQWKSHENHVKTIKISSKYTNSSKPSRSKRKMSWKSYEYHRNHGMKPMRKRVSTYPFQSYLHTRLGHFHLDYIRRPIEGLESLRGLERLTGQEELEDIKGLEYLRATRRTRECKTARMTRKPTRIRRTKGFRKTWKSRRSKRIRRISGFQKIRSSWRSKGIRRTTGVSKDS